MPSHTVSERKKRRKEKTQTLAQQISGGLQSKFPGALSQIDSFVGQVDPGSVVKRKRRKRGRRGVAGGKRLR